MTLATRCPDCATTFRLSLEQSRAAQGWVRCGRCGSIFLSESGPQADPQRSPQDRPQLQDERPLAPRLSPQESPALAQASPQWDEPVAQDAPPETARTEPTLDFATTPAPPQISPEPLAHALPEPVLTASRSVDELPRFVWESARPARPPMAAGVRWAWWSLVLLLASSAALQGLILWRNDLAARWPQMEVALRVLCEPLGCRIEPPRRLQALRIESSELSQVGPTLYELQIVVRNSAAQPLMWPAVDLSLTDASNKLVARRVLESAQLAVREPAIGPGRETVLRARLSTGERAVSGYTVELFYP